MRNATRRSCVFGICIYQTCSLAFVTLCPTNQHENSCFCKKNVYLEEKQTRRAPRPQHRERQFLRQEECVGGARLLLVRGGRVIAAWPGLAWSGPVRPGSASPPLGRLIPGREADGFSRLPAPSLRLSTLGLTLKKSKEP